jgi:membrane protein YqaA with SNARE-associated domain
MASTAEEPTRGTEPDAPPDEPNSPSLGKLAWRWCLALGLLLGVAFALGRWLRPELEATGQAFVERFGLWGMALGTLLADGLHFPVPPQFYMLLAIANGGPQLPPLLVIAGASLAGGLLGYTLAGQLGHLPWVARSLARSSQAATKLYEKHGDRVVLLASLTPIAFSVLCYTAGLCRLPKRAFALIALLRLPKLVAYYYLVRLGWG